MDQHKTPEDQGLELLKMCGPTEAEMIQEILRNNDIESDLQGEASANALPATGDLDEVRIWVRSEDAARARELVDALFTPVDDADLEREMDLGLQDTDKPGGA